MAEVISVSALNRYVKNLLDVNDVLFDLALRGEIANFVQNARSGHCYFSLRDEAASVRAVMFRSDARRLSFQPARGYEGGGALPCDPLRAGRCVSGLCQRHVSGTASARHSWPLNS